MNNGVKLLIFLALLLLPIGGRWLWYYDGGYTAPDIAEIDAEAIDVRETEYTTFEDDPIAGSGHILIDLAHNNNLEINDLAPLRDRLDARGVTVEAFTDDELSLSQRLRDATGLIIIAPTTLYSEADQEAITAFVEDGGRLLLAADPTRPVPAEDEGGFVDLFTLFFPTSAIPSINSIANEFGVVFFDDYLYTLDSSKNAGNYRDVRFRNFAEEQSLTAELESVVFFAAHSIRSDGIKLIYGDDETQSPVRTGETDLAAATLTEDEQVLALGDMTFLTAPYHTIGDNDAFMSRIADWMAVDERERDGLEDFPYLFDGPVDLVQASGEFLDTRLIAFTRDLQGTFEAADLDLTLTATPADDHDVIYVGTYDDLDRVESYLADAGITVTVTLTETDETADEEAISEEDEATSDEESDGDATFDFEEDPTEQELDIIREEADEDPTPDDSILEESEENNSPFSQEEEEEGDSPADEETDDSTDEESDDGSEAFGSDEDEDISLETLDDDPFADDDSDSSSDNGDDEEAEEITIEIASLGTVGSEGVSLFLTDRSEGRLVLLVLAEDGTASLEALQRLTLNDFEGCTSNDDLLICSTGEAQDGLGLDRVDEGEADSDSETSTGGGSIFILSDDNGLEGSRTSADEFAALIGEQYEVTVWSTSDDGTPSESDLEGFDAYILDSGDYAFNVEDVDAFTVLTSPALVDVGVMMIGDQAFPTFDAEYQPIEDLTVAAGDHPLLAGIESDEITLEESESGVAAVVLTGDDLESTSDTEVVEIVFNRGPESAESGAPALVAATNTEEDIERFIVATFSFYRLPEDVKGPMALNIAAWLVTDLE